jgi:IclR family pca regulon transcriptional regulator
VSEDPVVAERRPSRSYRVDALAKGLRLLSYFNAERPALRVKDLVDLSGIPMPTTFRLIATLEEEGYLERTVDGRVRPGTRVLALGFAAMQGLDLVQISEPVLRDLAAATGETVNLGVLYGDQVLFVARIPRGNALVAANLRVGSTVPAVFSSIGKMILAYLGPEEFDQLISAESFRGIWGPRAVRTLEALQVQLESARRDGYLVQREEAVPGLSSIAAPVRQAGGVISAAINVAVASGEYTSDQLIDRYLVPLLGASREISQRLGGGSAATSQPYRPAR